MSIDQAFAALQENVNADQAAVEEARRRRTMFATAFGTEPDAVASVPSGSLARGSQIEPINDVDLIWVYDPDQHPAWRGPGDSAAEALEHARDQVKRLLGSPEALADLFGQEASSMRHVRHTRLQNHAVKCFLDDPDDPGAFTVDIVPALARDPRGFWIPQQSSSEWIATDPVLLVDLVLDRHAGYGEGQFVQLLRVLKRSSKDGGSPIKGLAIEILALDHLPDDHRPRALARFFQAALAHIEEPILDPARLCGEVQPDLDVDAAAAFLERAADLSARAIAAAERGEEAQAQCLWHGLFGEIFPEPQGGCYGAPGRALATGAAAAIPRRPVQRVEEG
jgi:hypothetical protein